MIFNIKVISADDPLPYAEMAENLSAGVAQDGQEPELVSCFELGVLLGLLLGGHYRLNSYTNSCTWQSVWSVQIATILAM